MVLEYSLFEQVGEAVRSLMPDQLLPLRMRSHRRGVKVWFGPENPPREHYEAQVMPRRHVDGKDGMVIEVGFHAEHKELQRNENVVGNLVAAEPLWRSQLGDEAEVGTFFGADNWRRVSEVWMEPDLEDPELAFELAARLVDYLLAIEPIVSLHGSDA